MTAFRAKENINVKCSNEIYIDLCDAIKLINSTFTIHIVIVMASFLLTDVFPFHGIIKDYLTNTNGLTFSFVGNIIWIVFQFAFKLMMAHAGSSTTEEAEETLVIVSKLICYTEPTNPLKPELLSLLIQMRTFNKKLSSMFFNIDWVLIFSVRNMLQGVLIDTKDLYFSDNFNDCNIHNNHFSI